ncbi:MAG TPA: hypothetical protein VMU61_01210 [Candidatus Aquilonibacter sp.]|nr:hypothetical protein [Candidatus Aquilonibacter sp.]
MPWFRNPAPRHWAWRIVAACLVGLAPAGSAFAKKKPAPPRVRWSENRPGCTFSTSQDGKYLYGLWSGDVGLTLAVDAREVQIIRHRIEPIFAVFLTVHYRGSQALDVSADEITLQFLRHFKVVQTSLDPDSYAAKVQNDADDLDHEIAREVAKHPDEKQAREGRLQDYQKSASELIEFLSQKSLRPARLNSGNPEVSGWVYFNTDSKWLGRWKTQEEFVLRVPLAGKVFEFPFKLPPKKGELLLRERQ